MARWLKRTDVNVNIVHGVRLESSKVGGSSLTYEAMRKMTMLTHQRSLKVLPRTKDGYRVVSYVTPFSLLSYKGDLPSYTTV